LKIRAQKRSNVFGFLDGGPAQEQSGPKKRASSSVFGDKLDFRRIFRPIMISKWLSSSLIRALFPLGIRRGPLLSFFGMKEPQAPSGAAEAESEPQNAVLPTVTNIPLCQAAQRGDVQELRRLLAQGADPDQPDPENHNQTALFFALDRDERRGRRGRKKCARILLRCANLAWATEDGRTALMQAAIEGDDEAIRSLLPDSDAMAVDCDGFSALHWAAQTNSFRHSRCVSALASHSDANAAAGGDWVGETPFLMAAKSGNVRSMRHLAGLADTRALTPSGWGALLYAANSGNPAAVRLAATMGGNEARAAGGRRPLHVAAMNENSAAMSLLLRHCSAADRDDSGHTALHWAAAEGFEEGLAALIPHSDLMAVDNDGLTALHWAAQRGNEKCIELLLSAGSHLSPDHDGRDALHHAAANGHAECVMTLLAWQSDPLAIDKKGWNALHCAASKGRAECVKIFLAQCDPLAVDSRRWSALHFAADQGHAECVELLLPASDPMAKDSEGWTALHFAAIEGHAECVALLLTASDPMAKDAEGWTALHLAADQGHAHCVEALAKKSDILSRHKSGWSVLASAVGSGSVDTINAILAAWPSGVSVDMPGPDGHTPLMVAAERGLSEIVEALLPLSDSRLRADNGSSALILAATQGHWECVMRLLGASDAIAQAKDGDTALLAAIRNAKSKETEAQECLRALAEASKKGLGLRGREGLGAVDLALSLGQWTALDALVLHCSDAEAERLALRAAVDLMPCAGARLERLLLTRAMEPSPLSSQGAEPAVKDPVPLPSSQSVRRRRL